MKIKKGLSLLLCAFLLFGLCACTGQTNDARKESSTAGTTTTTKKTESTTKKRKTDFRNVCWGDSAARVKKEETADFFGEDDNGLVYEVTVDGKEMYLLYFFDNKDKLYQAMYGDKTENASFGQWKDSYDSLKKLLTSKYGKPTDSATVNHVDQSLIDAAGSQALQYGYVSYVTDWKLSKTNIRLGLTSQEYKINLAVIYTDKNHKEDPNDSGL